MEQKRRVEISVLNALFCLIVILIHVISYPVAAFSINTIKYNLVMIPWRLSSFVVQGFVMLAGVKLFLNAKNTLPYSKYLMGRIKGVIVPYAICFAAYYLYFVLAHKYSLDARFVIKNFFTGDIVCHLYFIPIIFQFDLLFPVWKRVVKSCSPIIVIPVAILFSALMEKYFPMFINASFPGIRFIYNDRLFTTYLSYWLIGCYIGKNYDTFCRLLKKYFAAVSVVFALCLLANIGISYLAYNQLAVITYTNFIHTAYALLACMFLYGVVLFVPREKWEKFSLIFKIDRASFNIYLYHMIAVFFSQWLLERLGILAQGTAFVIRMILVYGLTLPGCIIYQKIRKAIVKGQ